MVEFCEGVRTVADVVGRHFNMPGFSDTIVWGPDGECYYCFQMLLCAHSPVFERMFHTDMVEKSTKEVHIREVDGAALEKILRFLHTGRIEIDESSLSPIVAVADEYGITILMELCEKYATDNLIITESNWFKLFQDSLLARGRMDAVFRKCQHFLHYNILALVCSDALMTVGLNIVKWIANHATERTNEYTLDSCVYYEVVRALMLWLEGGNNIQYANELFGLLNLSLLPQNELSQLCSTPLMQQCPELSMNVVKVIADQPHSADINTDSRLLRSVSFPERESTPMYQTTTRGVWEEWAAPIQDWYYILCCGAHGADVDVGDSCPPVGGGRGAQVGGGFYLRQGDKIKMLLGWTRRGGGASCAVIVPNKWSKKAHLAMVAGGGGASGGMGHEFEPGRDAQLSKGRVLNDPKEVAVNRGCGLQLAKRIVMSSLCPSMHFLKGECLWCDGGIKGGGGGYHMGPGSVMGGGDGGGSYVNAMAQNSSMGYCSFDTPVATIWRGKQIRAECEILRAPN